jgi:hypothetical protein
LFRQTELKVLSRRIESESPGGRRSFSVCGGFSVRFFGGDPKQPPKSKRKLAAATYFFTIHFGYGSNKR